MFQPPDKDRCPKDKELKLKQYQKKLYTFLDKHSEYSASVILEKIKDSWLIEEQILLLIKENKHKEAIQRYVDKEMYQKAEEFCASHDKELGLMTTLLTVYLDYYHKYKNEYDGLVLQSKIQDAIQMQSKPEQYRNLALHIMRNHSAKKAEDALTVLQLIPEEWELKSEECNLATFLMNVFDHVLTIEENSKIGKSISKMEHINTQFNLNELKTSYLLINADKLSNVCKRKLTHKGVCIYPNGEAYHQRCTKDPTEDPITRQCFDIEKGILARKR